MTIVVAPLRRTFGRPTTLPLDGSSLVCRPRFEVAIQPGATPLRLVFHDGRVAEVSEIAPAAANEKSLPAMAG